MRAIADLVMHHSLSASYSPTTFAFAHEFAVQQPALADAMFAAQGALQLGKQRVDGDGGEEAQAAQVHGE